MKRLILLFLTVLMCACAGVPNASETPVSSALPEAQATMQQDAVSFVTAEPTQTPVPTATPAPTEAPTATPSPEPTPDPPFTMVWASDTQIMVRYDSMFEGFTTMCDWIANEAEARNFKVYLHSGDMVDNGGKREQWERFNTHIRPIAEKMPLFMTAGNHDWDFNKTTYWKDQFFVTEFPEEQSFNQCNASYMILTVDNTSLLLLNVCYVREHREPELAWLKEVCDAHPDLPAILIVHAYLTAEGGLTTIAKDLEATVVSQCPNIKLVLSGHARGISHSTFRYDDDGDGTPERTVNALMYDVQTDREHYGYLCLLTYDPADNSLFVDSYSPFLDDYIYNDAEPDLERFTIQNVF